MFPYCSKHCVVAAFIIVLSLFSAAAQAVELLSNRSFESPVAPNNGNNFYATLPNWTVVPTPTVANPVNLVVPHAGYANNPQATPTGGGRQYLDINGAGGTVSQSVTLSGNGFATFSVWFSVRDGSRNLAGGTVRLRNSSNVIVGSNSVAFVVADPISTWKNAIVSNLALTAGTYTLEVVMDNFHNIDLASFDFTPATYSIAIDKSANKTGPLVAGETVTYTYTVQNTGNWVVNNVNIFDTHNGSGTLPVPGSETLVTDVVPTGDTTDPAIATPALANGTFSTVGPGDTVRFTASYVMTQNDVDLLQ